jgi:hypothetical protein
MAAPAELLEFNFMTKKRLRRWVNANPTRVNDRDHNGYTFARSRVFSQQWVTGIVVAGREKRRPFMETPLCI